MERCIIVHDKVAMVLHAMRYFLHVHSYNDSVTQLEMYSLLRSLSLRKPSKKTDTQNISQN